jgi:DNA (cytosine-5)-methyltransferase 1
MLVRRNTGRFSIADLFAGAGGSSWGMAQIPGAEIWLAANHWDIAMASHQANFVNTQHYIGDIRRAPITTWPITTFLWASPECTNWTQAKGMQRVDDAQPMLFDDRTEAERKAAEKAARSRALMEEVPAYLDSVQRRGGLVLAGVVENVIEARTRCNPAKWNQWIGAFRAMGYKTKVIALNSMHVWGTSSLRAPQSRDRLYVAYWHESLRRDPDWSKWLRPRAWCETCEEWVLAVQTFKNPGADMGRYRAQYVYRCPHTKCRNAIVEPDALPAAAAIDWSVPAQRIGDRTKPLADKTMKRIKAGIDRYWRPVLVPTGGTWREAATPVDAAMPTRTTRENDGIAVPWQLAEAKTPKETPTWASPLLVPVEGREGKTAAPVLAPARTQTTRHETAVALPPFITEMRGGGSHARRLSDPAATFTAGGFHHALTLPPLVMRNNNSGPGAHLSTPAHEPMRTLTASGKQSLLVPYYTSGTARPVGEPMGALSTVDRYGVASGCLNIDIDQVRFRMLKDWEIGRAMAFDPGYILVGSQRDRVCQLGNAVTPPAAEVLGKALYEAITGEQLDREPVPV